MIDFLNSINEHDVHILKFGIGPLYAIIALQFGISALRIWRNGGDFRETLPLLYLVVIFILCDLSGYVGVALGWPHWILFLTHVGLYVGAIAYILTGQAATTPAAR